MLLTFVHYFATIVSVQSTAGSDIKRILMLCDTALYGDASLEQISSTVGKTATAHGGVCTRAWTDNWDTFSVHQALGRHNATGDCDLTLLVTVTQCHLCNTLQRQSDTEGISWIGICHSHGRLTRDDVIPHMIPCHWYYRQVKAVRHLVADMHLNDTVLLYDVGHASILATEIIRQQTAMGYMTLTPDTRWMTSLQWIEYFFSRESKLKQRVVVILTHTTNKAVVFEKALQANLVTPRYHWLIDMTSSNNSSCALSGVVTLSLWEDARKSYRLMELLNWMHSKLSEWLDGGATLRNSNEGMPERQCNISTFANPRTSRIGLKGSAFGAIFDLKKCMTSHTSSSCCNPTTIAYYNDVGRLAAPPRSHNEIFPHTFPGFYGRRFRVVMKHYPPFVKLSNGAYSGMCVELLDVLASALNFSYDLLEVPDGKFGIIDERGVWNGMIGMVHRKEVDFAADPLTITSDRALVVDFSFPYWEEPSGVLIRRPAEGSKLLNLLKPLQWSVWVTVILEVLLASGVIYACTACTNHLAARQRDSTMTSFENCLWFSFASMVNQDVTPPATSAGRLVASALWFVTVVVYAAFTGNMVAILAVEKRTLPFGTLEEMVQQTDYTWGTEDGIAQMMLFQTAKRGVYSEIWNGMTSHSGSIVKGSEAGFRKTRTENYAFIGDKTYLGSYAAAGCDLTLLPEEFYKVGFGFAFPKDWPYTDYFNNVIMKLMECGIVNRWKQQHWPRAQCRTRDTRLFIDKVTLAHMVGSFCIIFIGALVAFGTLLLECIRRPLANSNICHDDVPRLDSPIKEFGDVELSIMKK